MSKINEMKFWVEHSADRDRQKCAELNLKICEGRILSLFATPEGTILFRENRDEYFLQNVSPQDAIAALEEGIAWIKQQMKHNLL